MIAVPPPESFRIYKAEDRYAKVGIKHTVTNPNVMVWQLFFRHQIDGTLWEKTDHDPQPAGSTHALRQSYSNPLSGETALMELLTPYGAIQQLQTYRIIGFPEKESPGIVERVE